jgi:hypothetical protein
VLLKSGGHLMPRRNKLIVPGAEHAINEMKAEVANELGVKLGPDTTARENGSVGGEIGGQITKNLVAMALQNLANK